MLRTTAVVLFAASAVAAVGCGGAAVKRQPVAGAITFQQKKIQFGSVRFEPADGQPVPAQADIRDGAFSLARAEGPAPGRYKVWVQAFDRLSDTAALPGSEGPPPKDILPPRYLNEPAGEIVIREVPDGQPNQLTLDLK